ncbi:phage tail assembly protein [Paenibacillus sp. E222]|uniref:phage tail assembly protein n=1 Tax=Paenibacillus sp. E222 TaxID=2748863 RepID=UPI0015C6844F|nr:phage tail assembly protein [Paenibacillus sp. E222]QLG39395.1 phage tail assembly protein [Paenibacillus sp. E222]
MVEQEKKLEDLTEVQQAGVVVKLSRPILWEGVEYTELHLNFDELSGDDIIDVEGEFIDFIAGKKNVLVSMKDEHPAYHAVLAAKAAGVHPNFMKKLKAPEFVKVTGASKRFLNRMG